MQIQYDKYMIRNVGDIFDSLKKQNKITQY